MKTRGHDSPLQVKSSTRSLDDPPTVTKLMSTSVPAQMFYNPMRKRSAEGAKRNKLVKRKSITDTKSIVIAR